MRTTIISLAAALALSASIVQARETAPHAQLQSATAEVITLLKQSRRGHLNAGRINETHDAIESKILPLFDFKRMTQTAVGPHWATATPEQRGALTREFTTLLVRTYSAALRNYRNETIEFNPLPLEEGATQATVKSVVKSGATPRMQIDYDMVKTPAGWKIYEIRMDGVDVIANYRGSFGSKIQSAGIDGLVEALAEKNGRYGSTTASYAAKRS